MNTFYATEDFNFSAYLLTEGFNLDHTTTGTGTRKMTFNFIDPENKIPKLYTDYINGKLLVNLSAFLAAQKRVKNLIYA